MIDRFRRNVKMVLLPYAVGGSVSFSCRRRRCPSSSTKWTGPITQERFDSPKFTRISKPTASTAHAQCIWHNQLLLIGGKIGYKCQKSCLWPLYGPQWLMLGLGTWSRTDSRVAQCSCYSTVGKNVDENCFVLVGTQRIAKLHQLVGFHVFLSLLGLLICAFLCHFKSTM